MNIYNNYNIFELFNSCWPLFLICGIIATVLFILDTKRINLLFTAAGCLGVFLSIVAS